MEQIKKQVEFYFSDSNYRKDTFLRAAAESDSEGFVPISVLLTFNKLRNIASNIDDVANAVADSDLLVLSADKLKVKRREPLPEVDTSADRTLYVKGYPLDDPNVSIESIASYFSSFGKVNMVKLRKTVEKTFKGSALIEFSTVAEMNEALKATHTYNEKPFVQVCAFADWNNEKQAFLAKKRGEKRKYDGAQSSSEQVDEKPEDAVQYESGLVFRVSSLPPSVSALEVKQFFKKISDDVKFVDLVEGGAIMRVANANAANQILTAAGSGLKFIIEGEEESAPTITIAVLSGKDEENYWSNFRDTMRGRGGDKRSSQGGRGRGHKRQRR
mmetsp:Transcript_40175/g.29635  ORF Transcript_40175/g.29635 Transcript_40175/m.29635 type:complete len:329 (+) Transcript_40175:41-1027(+)|eukprot:CAMPEP_0202971884 /NCGR_PEP_ID=MMETSP1396-20130829/31888_1 /ASSEMBLY_ACC=CAM_ASM_000872 /TAXON_ID= /ORGANISM="Pseudokeronopsis sp., Strain Brazil" /LENGTH=328 /DNA_ID=CAMNT_0049701739 /DNA_START=34 /DNA_END=1020 /DNA_ORIENTATION=+